MSAFRLEVEMLKTGRVAALYDRPAHLLKRLDSAVLHVVTFSFPRPIIESSGQDREMHDVQWAYLLAELDVA
jgi:hypothetical protein